MAMDINALNELLEVQRPWTVRGLRFDAPNRRVEVSIGVELGRTWLGSVRQPQNESPRRWRHVAIGRLDCVVKVHLPPGASVAKQPWGGPDDSGFSNAMAKQVFAMLSEGVEYGAICNLLQVTFQDLWKFKFALDHGKAEIEPGRAAPGRPAAAARPGAVAPTPAAHPMPPPGSEAIAATSVPDVTSPVWQELAEGRLALDIRMLSLKLLLTRVRSQMELIHDREVRLSKLRELHRYFLKNERMLGHEITQLQTFQ